MLRLTLSVFAFVICASPVWAANDSIGMPAGQAERAEHELKSGTAVNDLNPGPQHALELADAMSEPEFLADAMAMSADPEAWMKAMEMASARGAPQQNKSTQTREMLSDDIYSSIDPQAQQALLSRLLDPKKPQRWMQAMSDPRFYMHALGMMSPATPMQWMKVTADGRLFRSMENWFDPKTYMNWARMPAPGPATKTGDKPPASYVWQPPRRY